MKLVLTLMRKKIYQDQDHVKLCFFPGSWKCRKAPVQTGALKHSLILVAILISILVSLSYIINAHVLRNIMKLMFVQVQAVKSAIQRYKSTPTRKLNASSLEVDASSPGVLQHRCKYLRREGKTGSKLSNCSSSEEVDSAEKPKFRKTHRKAAKFNGEVNLIWFWITSVHFLFHLFIG